MVDRETLRAWAAGYERAWRTLEGPELEEALAVLFAPGAFYQTAPFQQPYEGLPAIARMWQAERESPDEPFAMKSTVVAADPEERTGVLRLEVRYLDRAGQIYRDLWVLHFDEAGRCDHFEEWPFWPPGSSGTYARGPTEASRTDAPA